MSQDSGFLKRWSQRKTQAAQPEPIPNASTDVSAEPITAAASSSVSDPAALKPSAPEPAAQAPLPTLEDVKNLTKDSDFTGFMRQGVTPETRNAAMKELFKDPHYNIMDMMDVYVDDYSQPDPIPLEMLRTLNQSFSLGLFDRPKEEEPNAQAQPAVGEQTQEQGDQLLAQAQEPTITPRVPLVENLAQEDAGNAPAQERK